MAFPLGFFGDARERAHDRLCRRRPAAPEVIGERGRVGVIALHQLGQSVCGEQRRRERHERPGPALARLHSPHAPDIDGCHHARRRQPRNQTGSRQRGFSRPARTHDQQEGRRVLGRRHQTPPRLLDHPVAAEEHRRVLGLERRQTPEWRALLFWPG
jgi:hypothetical protein